MWYAFHWSCDSPCDFLVLMWLSGMNQWARVMSEIISPGSRTGTFFALLLRNRTKLANSAKNCEFAKSGTEAEILEKRNSGKSLFWKEKKVQTKNHLSRKLILDSISTDFDSGFKFQEATRTTKRTIWTHKIIPFFILIFVRLDESSRKNQYEQVQTLEIY